MTNDYFVSLCLHPKYKIWYLSLSVTDFENDEKPKGDRPPLEIEFLFVSGVCKTGLKGGRRHGVPKFFFEIFFLINAFLEVFVVAEHEYDISFSI